MGSNLEEGKRDCWKASLEATALVKARDDVGLNQGNGSRDTKLDNVETCIGQRWNPTNLMDWFTENGKEKRSIKDDSLSNLDGLRSHLLI